MARRAFGVLSQSQITAVRVSIHGAAERFLGAEEPVAEESLDQDMGNECFLWKP